MATSWFIDAVDVEGIEPARSRRSIGDGNGNTGLLNETGATAAVEAQASKHTMAYGIEGRDPPDNVRWITGIVGALSETGRRGEDAVWSDKRRLSL